MAVFGILMVCTGNICRSPLAELLVRSRLSGIPSIEVASAGTHARDDLEVPPQMVELAEGLGVDAHSHRPALIMHEMIDASDLILAMSKAHRAYIVKDSPRALRRVFTLREFARIVEGMKDEDLRRLPGSSPRDRLVSLVAAATARRGGSVPTDPLLDDVADPYGRDDESYRVAAWEIAKAVEQVTRGIRLAAHAEQMP